MDFASMMALEPHGTTPERRGAGVDVWVGTGPSYPWGGLYGGQIVAQALRAAQQTVESSHRVHSLHAYFVRLGDAAEPIRFEVERVRNGRSFCTRQVAARQSVGAILEMAASFQVDEPGTQVQTAELPALPPPDELESGSWTSVFDRRFAPAHQPGDVAAWLRLTDAVGEDPALQACALAYLSDDLPTDAVVSLHPERVEGDDFHQEFFAASLDHAMWFHRPMRVDEWHVQVFTCLGLMGTRGISQGRVFTADGTHAATISQEVLLRRARQ